jgi:hypothetical protein
MLVSRYQVMMPPNTLVDVVVKGSPLVVGRGTHHHDTPKENGLDKVSKM